ncbi:hypothetical protein ACWDYH_38600, partial [Nocardia goodfellowii]
GPRDLIAHCRNGYLLPVDRFSELLPGAPGAAADAPGAAGVTDVPGALTDPPGSAGVTDAPSAAAADAPGTPAADPPGSA